MGELRAKDEAPRWGSSDRLILGGFFLFLYGAMPFAALIVFALPERGSPWWELAGSIAIQPWAPPESWTWTSTWSAVPRLILVFAPAITSAWPSTWHLGQRVNRGMVVYFGLSLLCYWTLRRAGFTIGGYFV
ncbi:MAG: hypothetical protein CMJ94_00065 [Planctomycetes bacterium]|nr:hypothetical protein [Planctomycetota bacterium]